MSSNYQAPFQTQYKNEHLLFCTQAEAGSTEGQQSRPREHKLLIEINDASVPLPFPPTVFCSTDFFLKRSYKMVRKDLSHKGSSGLACLLFMSWVCNACIHHIQFSCISFPKGSIPPYFSPTSISLSHTSSLLLLKKIRAQDSQDCCAAWNNLCNADKKQTSDTILLTTIKNKVTRITHMLEVRLVLRHVAESASDRRGRWRMPWPRLEATSCV